MTPTSLSFDLSSVATQPLGLLLVAGPVLAYLVAGLGRRWALAQALAALAVALAVVQVTLVALGAPAVVAPALGLASFRLDAVSALMLLLVAFIGWVIVRFSGTYLQGDARQGAYLLRLMWTLATVALLVTTNHLGVLALAWVASSLSLHGLLTHFPERPAALMAARKKFLSNRLSEVTLLAALVLLYSTAGSLQLDVLLRQAGALAAHGAAQAAMALLAVTVLLRSAQLPTHGWLIQVMEAPTPVSALLHAGVVNIGGFVLISLAPLMAAAALAQGLLVAVGGLTAVVAALVMTTRISIKVNLAWSTCAQMGFMLMQCGLGLYELALLHLVAHSLYKAHAFLAAGGVVAQARQMQLAPAQAPEPAFVWWGSWLTSALCVGLAAALLKEDFVAQPGLWVSATVLSMALVPLWVGGVASLRERGGRVMALGLGVPLVYFALHHAFAAWMGVPTGEGAALYAAPLGWVAFVLAAFVGLFVVQVQVSSQPGGRLARRLYPWAYSGLYLDELFTRLTLRVWPAPARPTPAAPSLPNSFA
jgi:NAD(P)H-quinone oxidoreductase subunit 5